VQLELHPAAEAEAREAYVHYRDADPRVGARFLDALDEAIARIESSSERWPMYLRGTHRILLRRFPFALVYRVGTDHVLVLAVAHQKRRPAYWRRRGPKR
jgi:plasmid stabilization system protein ParE